jgi:hypothetical protein
VFTKPRKRGGHSPRWVAEPEEIKNMDNIWNFIVATDTLL